LVEKSDSVFYQIISNNQMQYHLFQLIPTKGCLWCLYWL